MRDIYTSCTWRKNKIRKQKGTPQQHSRMLYNKSCYNRRVKDNVNWDSVFLLAPHKLEVQINQEAQAWKDWSETTSEVKVWWTCQQVDVKKKQEGASSDHKWVYPEQYGNQFPSV